MSQRESETGGRKGAQREGSYLFIYLLIYLFFTRFKVMYFSARWFFFLSSLQQNFKVAEQRCLRFNKFWIWLIKMAFIVSFIFNNCHLNTKRELVHPDL